MQQSLDPLLRAARESLRRGDAPAACRILEQAARAQPDSSAIAFDLGHVYGVLGRFEDAAQQFARAVAWPGQEGRTWYALGYALGELGAWEKAACAMLVAARADPQQLEALGSAGECAHRLALSGARAPLPSRVGRDRASGKISVVVCSIDPAKLQRLRASLDRQLAGEDWELVHIADARSLCEGYNRGIARASGDLLVLCHDDIEILGTDFAAKLRGHLGTYDLIGVAGSTLASGPAWSWSGAPNIFVSVAYPQAPHGRGVALSFCGTSGPIVEGAQLLDGVFLAMRRSLLERVAFDEATFDGFHFYDLDFSYRAWSAGARTAICRDIVLLHQSRGTFKAEYRHYAERYRQKFPQACTAPMSEAAKLPEILVDERESLDAVVEWLNHFLRQETGALKAAVI